MLKELRKALVDLRAAPTGPTYREFRAYLDADTHFHEVIWKYAGNRFLAEATAHLAAQQHRFRLFGNEGVTDATTAIQEHEAVFQAIEEGSADKAREAMRRHVKGVLQRTIAGSRPR